MKVGSSEVVKGSNCGGKYCIKKGDKSELKFCYFYNMSRKYKFGEQSGAYFISFSTVNWIDVFTRIEYFDLIIESLEYCRKNKGMEIYGYCIMPSHIHLIKVLLLEK